jgi:hypothetical protein
MPTTPTARSIAWLRKRGMQADVVERWIPAAPEKCPACRQVKNRKRRDHFGIADIVAYDRTYTTWIQATSGTNVAARVKKLLGDRLLVERLRIWLNGRRLLEIHGWSKRGAAGKRKLWALRRVTIEVDPDGEVTAGYDIALPRQT